MAKKIKGQYSMDDYKLQQVDVRLRLQDGPAYYSDKPIDNPKDAVDVMKDVMKELDREMVCVVNLDTQLKPVNFNVVSIGSVCESIAPIQNIMKSAILSNTDILMLLHNHPSGSLVPSTQDYELTRRLIEASKLMGMQVADHIIVGGITGDTYSFRNHNPDMFQGHDIDLKYIHKMTGVAEKPSVIKKISEKKSEVPKQKKKPAVKHKEPTR